MKRLLPVAALLACMCMPAMAQRVSLADRVAALEQQSASQSQGASQANMELLNRTTQMQDEIRALRALVEQLQNDLDQARQRNREQYIDMDSRVSALEQPGLAANPAVGSSSVPAAEASTPVLPATPPSAGESADYQTAYALLIKQGDAVGAVGLFQDFLRTYPDSALAPNAWYWLAESYYLSRNFGLALQSFEVIGERFNSSSKAPDALLKSGYCLIELKNTAKGRAVLEQVIARYPNHPVAEMARSRLRGLSLGR